MKFVTRLESGERMSDLCREFGISRKTGYKFWDRYQKDGPRALYDESRRPERSPKRTAPELVERLVALRKEYPTWGARKLLTMLRAREPGLRWPVASTVAEILKRNGLVSERRRRRRKTAVLDALLRPAKAPNDVWCIDYKGQFRVGSGKYCFPLTLTDNHTRFLLACEGFEGIEGSSAKQVLVRVFREYGLPTAIRSDNGAPFASRGLLGLTRLSAWWIQLGIIPERIEPGHPEQNGRHERMHLTLKRETTRPPAATLLAQQERFDTFRDVFNNVRPHEALAQRPPSSIYRASSKLLLAADPALEYPLHDETRSITDCGHIRLWGRKRTVFVSEALAGQRVGLRELDDDLWLVTFAHLNIGLIEKRSGRFDPVDASALVTPDSSRTESEEETVAQ